MDYQFFFELEIEKSVIASEAKQSRLKTSHKDQDCHGRYDLAMTFGFYFSSIMG
jgi:hypothetical protein